MGAIQKYNRNQFGRAIDKIQNMRDKWQAAKDKVHGYLGTLFEVAKNGETFVGLNYNEVGNIRGAIREYVAKIKKELEGLQNPDNANAIKGETAQKAKDYVNAVIKVSNAYVSSLLAYSDQMQRYADEYKKKEEDELASSVADEAKALESSAEEYKEQEGY